MTAFRLAFLSLTRRWASTLMALTAIAISVACSGMLLRLYLVSGSRFSTMGRGGDAIVGAKAGGIEILLNSLNAEGDFPDFLPIQLYDSLKSEQTVRFEDGVEAKPSYLRTVIPVVFFGHFKKYRVMGTNEEFLERPDPADSLQLKEGTWAAHLGEVLLGSEVASRENLHLGDTVPIQPWVGDDVAHETFPLRVAGILKPSDTIWDRTLYSNVPEATQVFKSVGLGSKSIWGANVLHYFFTYLKPGGLEPLEALINKRTVGQVIFVDTQKRKLEELTGVGREVGFLMTVLIMLMGGLSVAAMLMTRFDAMTVQLAVLRAIGYSKAEIGRWLLWEGFLLGLSACIIGGLIDFITFPMIREMLGSALPDEVIVGSHIYQSAPVWGAAILATTLAVFIPLTRLYRQDVHFSLKGI